MPFKLALIQMLVEGGQKKANLLRAADRIREAARAGAQVALLPECLDLGWTHPAALTEAEPIPDGGPFETLRLAAAAHQLYVCAGLTEQAGDQVFNTAILLNPQGELLLRHRKLNELDIGQPYYARGDRLNVVDTELGRVGLMICADGFAQDRILSRSLGMMGAEVILSPGAWAVPADHDNTQLPYGDLWRKVYIPTAREFGCSIFGVSNVGPITAGPWEGRHCIGCSLAIDANGEQVLQGPYGLEADCILYVTVE